MGAILVLNSSQNFYVSSNSEALSNVPCFFEHSNARRKAGIDFEVYLINIVRADERTVKFFNLRLYHKNGTYLVLKFLKHCW